jgi:hypothetical protein
MNRSNHIWQNSSRNLNKVFRAFSVMCKEEELARLLDLSDLIS